MALPERQERPLTEVDISRLAREISRNLKPLALTLDQLQISSDQWDRVQNNPIFQQRLVEEAAIWSASTKKSIEDRISTKAAVMIEELLIDAVGMVQNPDLPGVARVQSLQFLANMAKLGDKAIRDDGSGRVQININIGGQRVQFDKETTEPMTIEGTAEISP
jgi:hypothetical protein